MIILSEEDTMVIDTELDSFKERLRQATCEIDNLKNSFSKVPEELSRIKNMLEIENLGELTEILDNYKGKISEYERKRDEAFQGAKKYSEELEKEKERLIKLWDAYKNQEEELSATEAKLTNAEERAKNAESAKTQIEEDYTSRIYVLNQKINENENKVKQFDEFKQKNEEFGQIRNQIESEKQNLTNEIEKKNQTISSMQNEFDKLKKYEQYSQYKEKYEEISKQYEKEKERLTKLYHLYEETEKESKKLKSVNDGWQNWFNSNKEVFDKLFSAAPPFGTSTKPTEKPKQTFEPPPSNQTNSPPTNDTPQQHSSKPEKTDDKPKKKRLRFKK